MCHLCDVSTWSDTAEALKMHNLQEKSRRRGTHLSGSRIVIKILHLVLQSFILIMAFCMSTIVKDA